MKKEEIQEWAQNPITIELKSYIVNELKSLQAGQADAYHPFEPQKTQEILANLNGARDTWEIIGSLLSGEWDYFIEAEEEDGKSIGD